MNKMNRIARGPSNCNSGYRSRRRKKSPTYYKVKHIYAVKFL